MAGVTDPRFHPRLPQGVKCPDCGELLPFLLTERCSYCQHEKDKREIERLTAERDSAIDHRNTARDEIERLRAEVKMVEADLDHQVHHYHKLCAENDSLKKQIAVSDGLKCPNCADEGFTPQQVGEEEWVQVQCEFCYTVPDSVFNRKFGE